MKTDKNIEDLFRDTLVDYGEEPPIEVWNGVKKSLLLKRFLRLKFIDPSKIIKTIYLSTIAGIIVLTGAYIANRTYKIDQAVNENTFTKKIDNAGISINNFYRMASKSKVNIISNSLKNDISFLAPIINNSNGKDLTKTKFSNMHSTNIPTKHIYHKPATNNNIIENLYPFDSNELKYNYDSSLFLVSPSHNYTDSVNTSNNAHNDKIANTSRWTILKSVDTSITNISGNYKVVVVDSNGYKYSKIVDKLAQNAPELIIMNVITPNGDGINDYWKITNGDAYGKLRVKIYNRSEKELFSTPDYKNDWDGKFKGRDLPAGTYYYVIETEKGDIFKGAISILR